MKAKSLMILGTASHVGKSVVAAGLCRLLSDAGYKVAPFKAQNMSNNSFVTREGGEMGRAQVVQAECARVEPHVDMNPILLKPSSDNGSQVIVHGKSVGHMSAKDYYNAKEKISSAVRESYERLASQYEILVIEGAGSCAEINLKENDIVNLKMAEWADARCVLVGDIDAGGIFASMIGTLDLLTESERARIDGLIINKFRGDRSLFDQGMDFIETKTGKKILGMIPHDRELWIDAEDGVAAERQKSESKKTDDILDIAIILLPRMSNFTDFEILRREPGIHLRYVRHAGEMGNPDLLILPGTKSTLGDLEYLLSSGFQGKIKAYFENGGRILGVCGGLQMLGEKIIDLHGVESQKPEMAGLGIFKMTTEFFSEKVLRRLTQPVNQVLFGSRIEGEIEGYEIHMGKSEIASLHQSNAGARNDMPLRGGEADEAIPHLFFVDASGRAAGTYIHGLFDRAPFRHSFLAALRKSCGKEGAAGGLSFSAQDFKEIHYNRLARLLAENLDLLFVQECLRLSLPLSLI
ncbi:MAG: cobyric acid synthase [Candidatus Omnitrophica bacterium]|nr:cobyric acid synthase [Candidatus Omnitrophota bacterium]